jgi:hypothetical protein
LRKLLAVIAVGGGLAAGVPGLALAAPNPNGTGQPNQSCQSFEQPGTGAGAPGNSGTSPGSVFNEPGFGSTNGGTGGNAYNNANAPSQYDVACFQQSQRP